jgi:hypothetical protein
MGQWSKKKIPVSLCLVLAVFILAGCVVHSINPFYTRDLISDMPALYGQWMLTKSAFREGTEKPWIFSREAIIIPGEKGASAMLSARFFKVNDMVFLDTIAAEPQEDMSLWWTLHISPMHTVSRVMSRDNELRVIPLNSLWMEQAVKDKTVVLPSVWHEEQKVHLFTASGAEWVEFLKKYGNDPDAFPEKDAFVFERHKVQ